MPLYLYKAISKSGQNSKGDIEAPDSKEATKILRTQGLIIINIQEKQQNSFLSKLSKGVPAKEKIIFTRQLSVMIKAGLPLVEALTALFEQTDNKNFRSVIEQTIQDVKGGSALSKAMEKHPQIFPSLFTNVIASGEKSGKLEDVLQNLADQTEKDYDIMSKVRGAMVYPIVILCALVGVVIFVMVFIMPQLKSVFAESGSDLPATTKMLFAISDAVKGYYYIVFPLIIAFVFVVRRLVATPVGKNLWDRLKLRLPIFGPMIKKIYMSRFSRTMAMLISAGLPMLEVIKTVREVINNSIYQESFDKISQEVENGIPLSEVIKKDKNFPPMVSHLLHTGERSGKLDFVLNEIAHFYDKEVDNITANLSTLIEPILMLIMGFGVAFVVISVLAPMYNLGGT